MSPTNNGAATYYRGTNYQQSNNDLHKLAAMIAQHQSWQSRFLIPTVDFRDLCVVLAECKVSMWVTWKSEFAFPTQRPVLPGQVNGLKLRGEQELKHLVSWQITSRDLRPPAVAMNPRWRLESVLSRRGTLSALRSLSNFNGYELYC